MNTFSDISSRPYDIGDILGKSLRAVFGRDSLDLLLAVVVLLAVSFGLYFAIFGSMESMLEEVYEFTEYETDSFEPLLQGPLGQYYGKLFLFWIANMVIYIIGVQYLLRRMKQIIFAESVPLTDTLQASLDPVRFLSLAVNGLLAGILVGIGTMLCFFPGLALMILLSLLPACVIFNRERFSVPFGELPGLYRGNLGKTIGTWLILFIAMWIISMLLYLVLMFGQMSNFIEFQGHMDSDELYEEMIQLYSSPAMKLTMILGGLFSGLCYLLYGFVSVVMYFNYQRRD